MTLDTFMDVNFDNTRTRTPTVSNLFNVYSLPPGSLVYRRPFASQLPIVERGIHEFNTGFSVHADARFLRFGSASVYRRQPRSLRTIARSTSMHTGA